MATDRGPEGWVLHPRYLALQRSGRQRHGNTGNFAAKLGFRRPPCYLIYVVYRAGEYSELCGECRRPAHAACARCDTPLCPEHAPGDERRCVACETLYLRRETDRVRVVAVTLVALAGVLLFVGAIMIHMARNGFITGTAAAAAPLVLYPGLAIMAATFTLPPLLRRRLRHHFLAERRA